MKFSTLARIGGLLVAALAVYAGVGHRGEILAFLKDRFPAAMQQDAAKPAAPPLAPLPRQIALCRKERAGYQSCMFDAGYAVNADWIRAHDHDHQGAGAARAAEVLEDRYRAGPSPIYGVPYWVPRPAK